MCRGGGTARQDKASQRLEIGLMFIDSPLQPLWLLRRNARIQFGRRQFRAQVEEVALNMLEDRIDSEVHKAARNSDRSIGFVDIADGHHTGVAFQRAPAADQARVAFISGLRVDASHGLSLAW